MPHVILVVADGVRPDTLASAIDAGAVPAMQALREAQGFHTLTTVFPSVTGPAYVPFLMGEHPGHVGLPGLRWFDRSRRDTGWPHFTRSYIGSEMRKVDRDLTLDTPTAFERSGGGLAMMNMIGRGLPRRNKLTDSVGFALRAGYTHFRGDVAGWLDVDRALKAEMLGRVLAERPPFTFASFCGVDKTSHSVGHQATIVREALTIVDGFVADVTAAATREGWMHELALFVVSDHGHVDVRGHDDLADLFRDEVGLRVLAHPKIFGVREPEMAVMVSGNAMAHLFVELESRTRPWWPALSGRWNDTAELLLRRPSVDLMMLPHSETSVEIRGGGGRGSAMLRRVDGRYDYECRTGDPLGLGDVHGASDSDAWERSLQTDYPDSLVQIMALNDCRRTGDFIVSATRDWDFRGRYEPIPHMSSHGALHREHMLVPMLTNLPNDVPWRRTQDVFHRAMQFLGV
ncbi:MAG: alkaline phosphatase family protein [Gemmatimonadaceae bacterium]|nr:alkaline phosphatase family protein [Gemmatimonadaceae bacterium]